VNNFGSWHRVFKFKILSEFNQRIHSDTERWKYSSVIVLRVVTNNTESFTNYCQYHILTKQERTSIRRAYLGHGLEAQFWL
jgi:hypothetical protein